MPKKDEKFMMGLLTGLAILLLLIVCFVIYQSYKLTQNIPSAQPVIVKSELIQTNEKDDSIETSTSSIEPLQPKYIIEEGSLEETKPPLNYIRIKKSSDNTVVKEYMGTDAWMTLYGITDDGKYFYACNASGIADGFVNVYELSDFSLVFEEVTDDSYIIQCDQFNDGVLEYSAGADWNKLEPKEYKFDKMPKGNVQDGWKTYTNEELGISFSYPKELGDVVDKDFGGHSEYFVFNNDKSTRLGGLYSDYWADDIGRGGSLIDPMDFPSRLNEEYKEQYTLSKSGLCEYTTKLIWFPPAEGYGDNPEGRALHATCLTGKIELPALNFSNGGNILPITMNEEDFILMVESFRTKENKGIAYEIPEFGIIFEVSSFDANDIQYTIKRIEDEYLCAYFSRESETLFLKEYFEGSYGAVCKQPRSNWEDREGEPRGKILLNDEEDVVTISPPQDSIFGGREDKYEEYKEQYPETSDVSDFLKVINETAKSIE